jgi:hypothetical protein
VQAINSSYGSVSATVVITIGEGAITSPTSVDGIVGVPFSYQITSDNNANRFTASALPPGLHFNSFAGIIFGTPSGSGTFPVNVVAINNSYGSVSATVVITISEGAITSGTGSQPRLTISRSGESFLLTWPVASDGFILEETQLQQTAWTNSPANVVIQGTNSVAIIPIQSTAKFYRLRK